MLNPPVVQHPASFPPAVRLRQRQAFDHVFSQPKKSYDRYWVVLARANNCSHARLGLVISKKRARLAVQRNRLKRLIRESFRQQQFLIKPLDIIVLARDGLLKADNTTLRTALAQHWKRLQR